MQLAGVLTPIPTPFDSRGDVDAVALCSSLTRWLATPLTGFVVLGSNGEAALLDEDESDRVVAIARDAVPRDRTFIVGTGRESTRAAIAATTRAAALGADAVLVRTPGFFKAQMTATAFVRHYTAIADASPIPVLLYNFTAVTGVILPIDAVAELAGHQNIAGMKESNGDVARLGDLVAAAPRGFSLLAGSASTFVEALQAGATGGILALASVVPDACTRLFELTRSGRHEEAKTLQQRLTPLAKFLGSTHGVPALKAALERVGCDVGQPRLPLMPLDAATIVELQTILSALEDETDRPERVREGGDNPRKQATAEGLRDITHGHTAS
jgi:4-hydroxy-2-oxoglutarate aldolase